jgi:enoyl-CoA hydratase
MSEILFESKDKIAILTLHRPQKLNAVTRDMTQAILAAVHACNEGDTVRCLIVTGAGDRAFCAGSDIAELDAYESPWQFRHRVDYCDALRMLRKPSICAVNGIAFGGGLEAAMCCDIRIAAAGASFAAPEIRLGWIGGGGMAQHLARSIGMSNAALMLMTGDPVDADQALRWGLVSEVLPRERLLERALALAGTIAARAPIAAETAKMNLSAACALSMEQALERERELQAICFATDDAREGRAAFQQKRAPDFRRR